jgi:hypothetical protein
MDGRTDWQAGGLPLFTLESTRRRLCVATPLICRQPDTSNSLRIFCLYHILSFIISFFSIFRPSLVTCTLFLSMCFCPATGIDLCLCRVPAQGLKRYHIFAPAKFEYTVPVAAAQDCFRICMRDHLVQHIEFLSSTIYCVTSSVSHQFFSDVVLPAVQID